MRRTQFRTNDLRLVVLGLVFVLAWGAIGYRLLNIQGAEAADLAQRGFDQRLRHEEIPAKRGTIFDRDGVELAVTVYGSALVADPTLVEKPTEAAAVLAPILGVGYDELADRLQSDGRFVYLARRLEHDTAEAVRKAIDEAGIEGLTFREEPLRIYPAGSLASPVVGLTRLDDGSGVEGIESVMDNELAGRPGKRIIERDQAGRAIPQAEFLLEPAVPGSDVVLTIDRELQYVAERALQKGIDRTNARGGAVVALDPSTGEILAMASLPDFDAGDRENLDPDTIPNRAVSNVYEPGSTLKVVTVAAALEEGVVRPDTPFETPKRFEIGGKTFTDHGYNPPIMTVEQIVAKSSNVGTIKIQRQLGNESHYRYLDLFGLGRRASIDFQAEATGRLLPLSKWRGTVGGASAAIGYGVNATPLQMAAVYGAIANDGEWVEPHVVSQIIAPDGTIDETEPRTRRVISRTTAKTIRTMLVGVVEAGTGRDAVIDGYTVGGKTGTTNRFEVETGRYSETDTIAWFIGIAPIEDPAIVIAVVLDTPTGVTADGTELKFGGNSSAPVFAEIAESALQQLGVPPTRTDG